MWREHLKLRNLSSGQFCIVFSCEYCDLRFHQFIDLKQHLKKHLIKSKLYQSAPLDEQKHNQQQQKQIENDQKETVDLVDDAEIQAVKKSSFLCPVCDKCFTNLMSYDVHVKKHSDDYSLNRDLMENGMLCIF